MKNKGLLIISVLFICLVSFSGCSSKQIALNNIDSKKVDSLIKVQKINDRTIIVSFGYDAVTAIKTQKGIVIVDAGISTALTARYKKTIENEFNQNDFIYLINTHGHHDHIGGNSIFSQTKVIGHENCLKDVSDRWTDPGKAMMRLSKIVEDYEHQLKQSIPNTAGWNDIFTQKIRYLSAYLDIKNHIPVKLPDTTFSDSLKLESGDITFEMIYFGRFHSYSDILIYTPELRIIFIGDLFSKFGRPDITDSSMIDKVRCRQAIKWIEKRINNIDTVIGGHGQILSNDDLKQFIKNVLSNYKG
jgi:cyclase